MNVSVYQRNDEGSSYDFFFRTVDSASNLTSVQRYSVSEQEARGIYERLAQWFGEKNEPEPDEHAEQEEPRIRGVYVTADRNLFLKLENDGDWKKCLNKKWTAEVMYCLWPTVLSCLPGSAFPLTLAQSHHEYDEPVDRCAYFIGDGRIITPGSNGVWHVGGEEITWDGVLMRTRPSDFPLRKAVPEEAES